MRNCVRKSVNDRMKKFLVIIFIACFYPAFTQNVEISGTALGRPNELVRLIEYEDQFSRLDSTIAATTTDVWGNFNMSLDIDKVNFAFLSAGLKRGEFYIEPDNSYHFIIHTDTVKGSVFDQLPLQFDIEPKNKVLNSLISQYNYDYNTFIFNNQKQLFRSGSKRIINEFITEINTKYADDSIERNDYFSNYIRYSLASLEWISKSKADSLVMMEYFIGKEVLYNNIAYTDFFRNFFRDYFKTQNLFTYDEMVVSMNSGNQYIMDSLLACDAYLEKDDEVRELAMMLLLARNFHNDDISQKSITSILTDIASESKFEKNRSIANNFKQKLTKLQYGSKAPPINLLDQNGDYTDINDFDGKFVLLNFLSSECNPCLFDFQKLQEIQSNLSDILEVVVIVSDGGMKQVANYCSINNFNWKLLNLDDEIILLENYEIKTFPTYIILNPDASVAMAPAPLPGENLELYIKGFVNRYQSENE